MIIGWDCEGKQLTIGNEVRICVEAKVIGKIKMGDNVTIGMKAVSVNKLLREYQ